MSTRRSSPVLVGRDEHLRSLEAAFADRAIRPVILVAGEAGIGKSRLVAELAASAPATGAMATVGSCVELGADHLPYAPFIDGLGRLVEALGGEADDILGPSPGDLAALLPDLARADMPAETVSRGRMYEAVRGLLDRSPKPLIFVLEDLHWADLSTLELLGYLARRLRHGRTALVATFRTDELHRRHPLAPALAELSRGGRATRIDLERLDLEQVGVLVRTIRADASESLVHTIAARSGGNPFLIEELLAVHVGPSSQLPGTLRDLLLARLGSLPEPSRRAIGVVAAMGRPTDMEVVEAAWEGARSDLEAALREAVDQSILVIDPSGRRLAFRHALIGEAVAEDLLPSERVRLHAALARVLGDRPDLAVPTHAGAAAEVAHHLFEAHDLPAALLASVDAADAAAGARAFPEARRLYERALELLERVPDTAAQAGIERIDLLDSAAEASFQAGDAARAVVLGREATAMAEGQVDAVRLGHLLGRLLEWSAVLADPEELASLGERAVALVPGEPPTVERAFALLSLASARSFAGRHGAALALARESAEIAIACGAIANEANAYAISATSLTGLGRDREAVDAIDRAVLLADRSRGSVEVGIAHMNRAAIYSIAGRFADLPAVLAAARMALDREGLHDMSEPWLATDEVDLLAWEGRWDEAIALATRMLEATPVQSPLGWHLIVRGRLQVRRGMLDDGAADLQAACDMRPRLEPVVRAMALGCLAEAALARREHHAALALVDAALAVLGPTDEVPRRADLFALGLWAAADLTEWTRARRDASGVADAAAAAASHVAGLRAAEAGWLVDGGATEGRVTSRVAWGFAEEGRRAGVADARAWGVAAAGLAAAGEPYLAARCRYREAEAALTGRGDRAQAEAVLREARTWAAGVGALPLVADIDSLARRGRLDVADGPPPVESSTLGAPGQTAADPYGLSPREQEVLALLVEGRTNREIGTTLFISEKTASSHVTHILDKLGVTSRGAAAAVAARGGLLGPPQP